MKCKDYEPIKFEVFQSDMEKQQFFIGEAIKVVATINPDLARALSQIKDDYEHKISIHKSRGEWK